MAYHKLFGDGHGHGLLYFIQGVTHSASTSTRVIIVVDESFMMVKNID